MDISDLRKKAGSGSVVAQSILGICYLDGTEVEVNYPEAFRFLSAAAEKGASRAIANLARMHAEGLGIPKNVPEAIHLFERAAKAGEFLAQIELARIYSRGVSVPVDRVAALRWYSAAVTQENKISDCEELQEAKAYVANAT
ncbi:MAG: tetratricopeptide repeat protein [Candidatus Angelobacter sp.]